MNTLDTPRGSSVGTVPDSSGVTNGVSHAAVDALVTNAMVAADEFERLDQDQVDHIVREASVAALRRHTELARLAVAETGRGVVEDKAVKNIFACENVARAMAGVKTVGVVRRDELDGIVEIAAPVGVICAITPVTNPTSTVIFKALLALKTRNPIVFSFHHAAHGCSAEAAGTIRDAAVAAGAPSHCVQWIDPPSRQACARLMRHDDVAVVFATGGRGLVRAAYSSGKPALGVGAGNVPVYFDHTADLRRAVHDVVLSKSFDNGMVCSSEQTVILDDTIAGQALKEFARLRAHLASEHEKELLERYLFDSACSSARLSTDAVGRPAAWIAEKAGFHVPTDTSLILAEVPEIGEVQPLTREKLCPVLAVVRADTRDTGMRKAELVLDLGGNGHTAVIHTEDAELAEEFGKQVKAARVLWNCPATHGGIGDLYNAFPPSLSLGCGSYGGNSVSGNIQAVHLLNIKSIGRRNTAMRQFTVPPRIYFEPHSLRALVDMPGLRRVIVIAEPDYRRAGHVQRVSEVLARRAVPVDLDIVDDIEPSPSTDTVRRGAERIHAFEPDTLIAIGGGSLIDAAKVMWLLYEHPDVRLTDLWAKFLGTSEHLVTFPRTGTKARLVCIPTTSGGGAEVTPFAMITDPVSGLAHPLADDALTPSVVICDPTLTTNLPPDVTAESGFDALTDAIEAYVSVHASDYTDGLCLTSIRLVFDNLERAVHRGRVDARARQAMHNAGTIAGMAIGNTLLGMVRAMAHILGGAYELPPGRVKALLLPHAIRYNGAVPGKLTACASYEHYQAPERLQQIARWRGLPAATARQGVTELAQAVEDLRGGVDLPHSFRAVGIDEHSFLTALPEHALDTYQRCAATNPRLPTLTDLQQLMRAAYYGT